MSSLDVSRLSGPDAITAMRSYPRRFRAAALPIADDPEAEDWASRIGPTGQSALEILVNTTNSWILLAQALHRVLVQDQPVLHPGVSDPNQREWEVASGVTVHVALEQLADAATDFVAAMDRIPPTDWARRGRVAGSEEISALGLAREAVLEGSESLRSVELAIAAVGRS